MIFFDRCTGIDVPLDAPVEHVIVLVPFTDEEIPEELPQIGVVRLVVKSQGPSVVQEYGKLVREATAEKIGRSGHLFLHDPVILLLLSGGFETLPGERTTEEIHEDVSEGFEVVAASLFDTQVSIDGRVTSSAGQVLVLPVGDVQVGLWVPVLLGEAEIDHIDLVATLSNPHQEIVRLDVTVDEVAGVDVLDTRYLQKNDQHWGVAGRWVGLLHTSWSASSRTVLRVNLRLQKLKRSSREGPRRSMTIAL